jgi:flagellar protein FliS
MARKRGEETYAETAILTASQEELILKVYDGLIQFTRLALEKILSDPRDIEYVHKQLRKAQRACTILMSSLNFEVGGDIAPNLFRVYESWHHQLVLANMRQDRTILEELLPIFKEYRVTWATVVERHNESLGKVKPRPEIATNG